MPTMDDYLTRPVGVPLDRLRSTPEEAARLLEGRDDNHLGQLRRTLDGRP